MYNNSRGHYDYNYHNTRKPQGQGYARNGNFYPSFNYRKRQGEVEDIDPHPNTDIPIIKIRHSVKEGIRILVDRFAKSTGEVGWIGHSKFNEELREFTVDKIFVPKQTANFGNTTISGEGLVWIDINEPEFNSEEFRYWGHSHGPMGSVYPSGQDEIQMREFASSGVKWFCGTIHNTKGDIYGYAIDVEKGKFYKNIKVEILPPEMTEEQIRWLESVEQRVTYNPIKFTNVSQNKGSSTIKVLNEDASNALIESIWLKYSKGESHDLSEVELKSWMEDEDVTFVKKGGRTQVYIFNHYVPFGTFMLEIESLPYMNIRSYTKYVKDYGDQYGSVDIKDYINYVPEEDEGYEVYSESNDEFWNGLDFDGEYLFDQ